MKVSLIRQTQLCLLYRIVSFTALLRGTQFIVSNLGDRCSRHIIHRLIFKSREGEPMYLLQAKNNWEHIIPCTHSLIAFRRSSNGCIKVPLSALVISHGSHSWLSASSSVKTVTPFSKLQFLLLQHRQIQSVPAEGLFVRSEHGRRVLVIIFPNDIGCLVPGENIVFLAGACLFVSCSAFKSSFISQTVFLLGRFSFVPGVTRDGHSWYASLHVLRWWRLPFMCSAPQ